MSSKVISNSVQETQALGAQICKSSKHGDVFGLVGDLGTGKTEFVRGFIQQIDPKASVRSPSFSIVNSYNFKGLSIYHFDFYRISDISELTEIGLDDFISSDGICLIEWANLFKDALPSYTKWIHFSSINETKYQIEFC